MSPEVDAAFIELLPWLDTLLSTWELYLRVGGFPRAVSDQLAGGDVQDDFVRALWDVTAGEAIRGAGTTPAQVQAMLERLTRSLSSPLAVESLRQDMGVESPHTAKARLQDMVFAYLAWPCHQRDGAGPRLSAQSKYYFIDPLMARLAPLRSEGMAVEADPSAVNEQQLGLELIRNVEREQPGTYTHFSDVMYQRTATKEVDFCGPRLGNMGFEGKYVDSGWRREALTSDPHLGGVCSRPAVCWTPVAMCGPFPLRSSPGCSTTDAPSLRGPQPLERRTKPERGLEPLTSCLQESQSEGA